MSIEFRRARKEDAGTVRKLLQKSADERNTSIESKVTEEILARDIEREAVGALLAMDAGNVVGMLLFYWAYSTWEGQFFFMEDLYIREEHRGKGYDTRLFKEAGKMARERNCARFQWMVLDRNESSHQFYAQVPCLNLTKAEGWLKFQLDKDGFNSFDKIEEIATVELRRAGKEDVNAILGLIRELAEYEKMPDGPKLTEEILGRDIEREAVGAVLLMEEGKAAGMHLYFWAYSSLQGQYFHMEDLYVKQEHRGKGYGKLLFKEAGKIAREHNSPRIVWNVLDWNENAIKFYGQVPYTNVTKAEGWLEFRLDKEGIETLANG